MKMEERKRRARERKDREFKRKIKQIMQEYDVSEKRAYEILWERFKLKILNWTKKTFKGLVKTDIDDKEKSITFYYPEEWEEKAYKERKKKKEELRKAIPKALSEESPT